MLSSGSVFTSLAWRFRSHAGSDYAIFAKFRKGSWKSLLRMTLTAQQAGCADKVPRSDEG